MDVLRATGDEQLARQLWGDNCEWVEERQQFMPTRPKTTVQLGDQDVTGLVADDRLPGGPTKRTARRASRKAGEEPEA